MHALTDKGPEEPLSNLYVHIPFCTDRCTYCAFATVPNVAEWHQPLVRALLWELSRAEPVVSLLSTAYLGGGTPGLLDPADLESLLTGIRRWAEWGPEVEVTLEVNPSNITKPRLQAWSALGINRLSVGVQSFDDAALRQLARHHDGDTARHALELLAAHWSGTWSTDLLVGWGGQSLSRVEADLDELLRFEPPHVSIYGLTVEPRTALASMAARDAACLAPTHEDAARDALWVGRMRAAGLERYEVSNFARPGHRSRHNQAYWGNREYLGVGPGASSSRGAQRWSNTSSTRLYLDHAARDLSPRQRAERLTPEQRLLETLSAGLRTIEGLSKRALMTRFGESWSASVLESLRTLARQGYLETSKEVLKIPEESLSLADAITEALVARHGAETVFNDPLD